jgi:hypothetical protein
VGSVIPLRFRPTIVVCVGPEGKEIGAQLGVLLPSLDAARLAGVALLAAHEHDGALTGRWFMPGVEAVTGEEFASAEADEEGPDTPLDLLVVQALRGQDISQAAVGTTRRHGVLEDTVLWRIKDEGTALPEATVVVWVAAAADTPILEDVCRAIQAATRSEHVDCQVMLALSNTYPHDPDEHRAQAIRCAEQPWKRLLVREGGEQPLATFAYFFETHGEKDTFWERPGDIAFAAAEAIFVLTATGITTTRVFGEMLRRSLPQMVRLPFERMSSVGSSRLTFPRAHAEQFCASRLAAEVMRAWAREPTAPKDEDAEQQAAAQALMRTLRRYIDNGESFLRGSQPSPRLSAEGVAEAQGKEQPDADAGLIFHHFRWAEIERLQSARRDLPEVLELQNAKAARGLTRWQQAVEPRWLAYRAEVEAQVAHDVNELVLRGPVGVTQAHAFVKELNRLLLAEKQSAVRQEDLRKGRRLAFLDDMDERATGEWEYELQPADPAEPQASRPNSALDDADSGEHDVPLDPDDERRRTVGILARLSARYRFLKRRVPPVGALVGAGLAAVPPAFFLAQTLLPPAWLSGRLVLPLLTLALVAFVALSGWGYRYYRRRQVDEAASDLRRVYRATLSYRCEEFEQGLRLTLLEGVQWHVGRILGRLADWERFVLEIAAQLEEDADRIEYQLFDGPVGRRDVLIANRQRLRPYGYNLHGFEEHVSQRRTRAPLADYDWHATPAGILTRLREHLGGVNLIDSTPAAIARPLRAYCLTVVQPYLTGDLVNLGAALDALPEDQSRSLFDTLLERSVILYHPSDRPRPAGAFIAARDEYRVLIMRKAQATGAVMVRIEDDEWLATLRLLPGGAVPSFWEAGASQPLGLPVPKAPDWTPHSTGAPELHPR